MGWLISAAIHAGLLAVLSNSVGGQFIAAAGNQQGDMVVSLVRASTLEKTAPSASPAGDLQPLFTKWNPNQPPIVAETAHPEVSEMLQRLQTRDDASSASTSPREIDMRLKPPTPPVAAKDPTANGENGVAGRAGAPGLSGLMEPCWRKLEAGSVLPVVLEVTLDLGGQIAKPPKIVRSENVPLDEPRLRAEARALAALSACLPRGGSRFGGQTYRLEFRPAM
jgi:hypothetical protein